MAVALETEIAAVVGCKQEPPCAAFHVGAQVGIDPPFGADCAGYAVGVLSSAARTCSWRKLASAPSTIAFASSAQLSPSPTMSLSHAVLTFGSGSYPRTLT